MFNDVWRRVGMKFRLDTLMDARIEELKASIESGGNCSSKDFFLGTATGAAQQRELDALMTVRAARAEQARSECAFVRAEEQSLVAPEHIPKRGLCTSVFAVSQVSHGGNATGGQRDGGKPNDASA